MPNVVVLPAPLGPSRPTTSPDDTSSATSRTTVRPPYVLVRPCVCRVGIYLTGSLMEIEQLASFSFKRAPSALPL